MKRIASIGTHTKNGNRTEYIDVHIPIAQNGYLTDSGMSEEMIARRPRLTKAQDCAHERKAGTLLGCSCCQSLEQ